LLRLLAVAACATLGLGRTALAADTNTQSAKTAQVQEVVVTGSRLGRSTFTSPNPVTVLNAQEIQKLGITNVGDVMAQLPQNSNFFAGNNVGLGNFNVGAQLANLRGLNPFFGTRTLTLIDTRRVVPTTTGGGVDVTLVPSMLVGRTETVTGGASAVYGSDAVAGVVNIILDTKFTGFKGQADYGQTSHDDGADWHASAAYGVGFDNDRGHFVIGGEFEKQDAIGICSDVRDWCSSNYAMFTNTGYAANNGQPHYIIGANGTSANTSLTGVIAPCTFPYAGACVNVTGFPFFTNPQAQFTQDGSGLMSYDQGLYSDGAGFFGFRQGGDNQAVGAYASTTMRPEVTRYTTLAHVNYDLTEHLSAFLEGDYARSEAVNPVANGAIGPYALEVAPSVYVGFHITPDNAYLTPAESAYIGPFGAEFGRNMLNVQTARNATNNTTWRITGGFKGDIAGSWGWDGYAEYGVNKNDQHLYHNVVGNTFLTYAVDAVHQTPGDPTSPIVCRATDPAYGPVNPDAAGCVPINLFGNGHASQQAIDYAFRTLMEFSTYTQTVVSGNVHGELTQGWGAGPVKLEVGGEYRREHIDVTHDLQDQPFYSNYTLSYGQDYAGSIEVLEGYGELNVPLVKDLPLAHYAELDAAFRETRNSVHNETTEPPPFQPPAQAGFSKTRNFDTWKVSAIWDITDWLRLRGTRSRDVRAAGFRELFESYAVTAGGPFGTVNPNPWTGLPDPANITTGGDVNLKPEKADTWTAGVVLSPKSGALQGLQLSADWYQIDLKDAIVGPPFGLGVNNIVGQCFQGVQAFCDRMTRDPVTNDILTVNNSAVNIGSFLTRGFDFEGDYNLPLEHLDKSMSGDLGFRVIASYLYDMIVDAGLGAAPVNFAGQTGPTAAFGGFNTSPKWQVNAFMTYSNGPFSGTVQLRYIGPGRFETLDGANNLVLGPGDPGYSTTYEGSINNNHVPSAVYVNLAASYKLPFHNQAMEVFGRVDNLFDKNPPVAPGGNGYPTNPVYFDTYGTTWKMGLRVRF
jgi:outer membrane receptor protein involved in Fe transport